MRETHFCETPSVDPGESTSVDSTAMEDNSFMEKGPLNMEDNTVMEQEIYESVRRTADTSPQLQQRSCLTLAEQEAVVELA